MTDESDQIPFPPRETRRMRQRRQREAMKAALADRPTVAPPLNAGPGRTRILDPDQATLDENIRRLYGAASAHATREQAAAYLVVSVDTLSDFLDRYPSVKEKWEDLRHNAVLSIRVQLFKNVPVDPATARWMGERVGGILDPLKAKEIDIKERELALKREEYKKTYELKMQEIAQRERELVIKEREFEFKIKNFGAGPPIDIKSLSTEQLMQLAERIRAGMEAPPLH